MVCGVRRGSGFGCMADSWLHTVGAAHLGRLPGHFLGGQVTGLLSSLPPFLPFSSSHLPLWCDNSPNRAAYFLFPPRQVVSLPPSCGMAGGVTRNLCFPRSRHLSSVVLGGLAAPTVVPQRGKQAIKLKPLSIIPSATAACHTQEATALSARHGLSPDLPDSCLCSCAVASSQPLAWTVTSEVDRPELVGVARHGGWDHLALS